MITYSLLMTVGIIAFVVGGLLMLLNFFGLMDRRGGFGIGIILHLFLGMVTWVGGVLTFAGFVWFLVSLLAHR